MWVRGHWRSLTVPFECMCTVFYSPSIVTMAVSLAISEIFSVKEWRDLENQVRGRSRSLKMVPFDRRFATYYWSAIVNIALSCTIFELFVCSTACTVTSVKHLHTSWNCANQSQVSHHGNISDPPPDSSWSYRATGSAPMADGLSVWLVRRSGIPCQTACGIRLLVGTASDNFWRRLCSQCTDAFSALEVSRRCAI